MSDEQLESVAGGLKQSSIGNIKDLTDVIRVDVLPDKPYIEIPDGGCFCYSDDSNHK